MPFLSYYHLTLVGRGYYKHTVTNVALWLSCYVYNFAILSYLTTVNQCLTIFFVQKLYVIGNISIRWSENKQKTVEKVDILKTPTVNHFFNK